MLVYGAGAAFFCLEPEPTPSRSGRSRSRLRALGHLEPEPPKKVAAPQHCKKQFKTFSNLIFTGTGIWYIGSKKHNCSEPLFDRDKNMQLPSIA